MFVWLGVGGSEPLEAKKASMSRIGLESTRFYVDAGV